MIDYVINYCDNLPIDEKTNLPIRPNIIIFFDEIFTVISKNAKLSEKVLSFISQLRKRGVIIITTAQEWLELNMTFRRYCRYAIKCRMFSLPFINTAFQLNSIEDAEQITWDDKLNDYVSPIIQTNFSKCNKMVVDSYDTYETIKTKS